MWQRMNQKVKIEKNNSNSIPLCKSSWVDLFDFFVCFNKALSKAASWGLRGWDLLLGAADPAWELVVEPLPGVAELLWEACEREDLGALDEADEELATVLVLEVDETLLTLNLGFGLAAVEENFLEPDERVVTPDILNSKQKVRG